MLHCNQHFSIYNGSTPQHLLRSVDAPVSHVISVNDYGALACALGQCWSKYVCIIGNRHATAQSIIEDLESSSPGEHVTR